MCNDNELLERLSILAKACPELSHTFRFMTGAIAALRMARSLGHKNRAAYSSQDRVELFDELLTALEAIRNGSLPSDRWMAGFYYHSAIMRIDACYERFLKAMDHAVSTSVAFSPRDRPRCNMRMSSTEKLALKLEQSLQVASPLQRENLEWTREEVNNLKHELFGHRPSHAKARAVVDDLENAYSAVDQLLRMMERREVLPQLQSAYSSSPPE